MGGPLGWRPRVAGFANALPMLLVVVGDSALPSFMSGKVLIGLLHFINCALLAISLRSLPQSVQTGRPHDLLSMAERAQLLLDVANSNTGPLDKLHDTPSLPRGRCRATVDPNPN